jgi:hypothetical protein
MRKMRLRNRRNRNLGMPAMILGAAAAAFMARTFVPELVRYIRLKSM